MRPIASASSCAFGVSHPSCSTRLIIHTAPTETSVKSFLAAVTDRANQPVYIHCGSANRVGAMWLIKRVVVDGWEVPRATEEATAIGLTSAPLRTFATEYATAHRRK